MNYAERMLAALTREKEYGLRAAWLSFMACYTYTRSFDGVVINDQGETLSFGRWYSFVAAVRCSAGYLRRPSTT